MVSCTNIAKNKKSCSAFSFIFIANVGVLLWLYVSGKNVTFAYKTIIPQ